MPNNLIVITEVQVESDRAHGAIETWLRFYDDNGITGRQLYRNTQGSTLMELTAVSDGLQELPAVRDSWKALWHQLTDQVASDYRRQLLHHVESPKPSPAALPQGRYVQLRHIEVPPSAYAKYRAWREDTIFDVVRHAPEVESFDAYHSVFSTEPGVMFVSSFSGDPQEYTAVFTSARYQRIIQEAGDQFIVGGERGLWTTVYERVTR